MVSALRRSRSFSVANLVLDASINQGSIVRVDEFRVDLEWALTAELAQMILTIELDRNDELSGTPDVDAIGLGDVWMFVR